MLGDFMTCWQAGRWRPSSWRQHLDAALVDTPACWAQTVTECLSSSCHMSVAIEEKQVSSWMWLGQQYVHHEC